MFKTGWRNPAQSFYNGTVFTEIHDQDVNLFLIPGSEEQKLALHSALLHYGSHEFYEKPPSSRAISIALRTNPSINNLGTEVEVVTRLTSTLDVVSHITINIDTALISEDGTPEVKLNRETILAEVLPNESKILRYFHTDIEFPTFSTNADIIRNWPTVHGVLSRPPEFSYRLKASLANSDSLLAFNRLATRYETLRATADDDTVRFTPYAGVGKVATK